MPQQAMINNRGWAAGPAVLLAVLAASLTAVPFVQAAPPATQPGATATRPSAPEMARPTTGRKLRHIRVAIFGLDVQQGMDVESGALTDQINVRLSVLPEVTIVNRTEIEKVAKEHELAAQGLVEMSTAVKLGKFLNAQYIAVGRASRIGSSNYLVLKIVDVETTVQTTISAKESVDKGIEALLENLGWSFKNQVQELQGTARAGEGDGPSDELVALAKPLAGQTILVCVEETHLEKPLPDPAAQMSIVNRLRALGVRAIAPTGQDQKWKEQVMASGTFDGQKISYLLEGEGISARLGTVHGLISCRARVELRLIAVPGRSVIVTDKGVGARVDVVEAFAAKSALEEAGTQAGDAIVRRLVQQLQKEKKPEN